MKEKELPVGVIGAGSFGTVIANLLARHRQVYLYSRNPAAVDDLSLIHI